MADLTATELLDVAAGCFVLRYPEWDVSSGVVVGADGVLVVDTRGSLGQGRRLADDVRRVAPGRPVLWVVNTHQHFDHTFGNAAFGTAVVHAHENTAAGMAAAGDRTKEQLRTDASPDETDPVITAEVVDEVLETPYRLPDVTFSSATVIDLGDRYVELVHPGRGHTDGDLVLRVPDADVVFAGDLVEQSAPPAYGPDCFPLEWASSLDLVVGMLTDNTVVVPGHGAPVDRQFVQDQRADVSDVGELIRSAYGQGMPEAEVLDGSSGWPFPTERLVDAVRRGYSRLAADAVAAGDPTTGRYPAKPPIGTPGLPLST
ncbi:MAG: Fumarylacetoacetase [uncultured Nocardioidaceae bacterium]|uniref:Fumarylacetoacetase n=1 Tax=uncultured Nocardioidaceae bacterium TaxID=253824 RepID=A0A6J4MXG0_9ACTN|nr:MAG: Fumarylacetoacetase [uncultured Nocardioidaceae bacterium]